MVLIELWCGGAVVEWRVGKYRFYYVINHAILALGVKNTVRRRIDCQPVRDSNLDHITLYSALNPS
jgi:hypothetical protein